MGDYKRRQTFETRLLSTPQSIPALRVTCSIGIARSASRLIKSFSSG